MSVGFLAQNFAGGVIITDTTTAPVFIGKASLQGTWKESVSVPYAGAVVWSKSRWLVAYSLVAPAISSPIVFVHPSVTEYFIQDGGCYYSSSTSTWSFYFWVADPIPVGFTLDVYVFSNTVNISQSSDTWGLRIWKPDNTLAFDSGWGKNLQIKAKPLIYNPSSLTNTLTITPILVKPALWCSYSTQRLSLVQQIWETYSGLGGTPCWYYLYQWRAPAHKRTSTNTFVVSLEYSGASYYQQPAPWSEKVWAGASPINIPIIDGADYD